MKNKKDIAIFLNNFKNSEQNFLEVNSFKELLCLLLDSSDIYTVVKLIEYCSYKEMDILQIIEREFQGFLLHTLCAYPHLRTIYLLFHWIKKNLL